MSWARYFFLLLKIAWRWRTPICRLAGLALILLAAYVGYWWFYQIAPIVLHIGVRIGGNSSWNSCGPDIGERCRHNIKLPTWMVRPEGV